MWWLLACVFSTGGSTSKPGDPTASGPSPIGSPPDTASPATTADTSTSGTADTGFTPTGATGLPTSAPSWAECATGSDPYDGWLLATPTAPGQIVVQHHGTSHGCGCALAGAGAWWFEDEGNLMMRWYAGDCDAIYCCDFQVTIDGLPAGTWTVNEAWEGLSTSVTVE